MIFVTIGSMFPFDRMIRAMDAWAADAGQGEEILAQIGDGAFEPRHMTWVRRLDRPDYAAAVARSRLVVAHAGIGSIVSAAEIGKPIVVLPRRAAFGEHTSDHQVETVSRLHGRPRGACRRDRRRSRRLHRRRGRGRRPRHRDGEDRRSRLHRAPARLHRGLNAPRFDARARCPRNEHRHLFAQNINALI